MQYIVDDQILENAFSKLWNRVNSSHDRNEFTVSRKSLEVDGYMLEKKIIQTENWKVEYSEAMDVDGSFDVVILKSIDREAFIDIVNK